MECPPVLPFLRLVGTYALEVLGLRALRVPVSTGYLPSSYRDSNSRRVVPGVPGGPLPGRLPSGTWFRCGGPGRGGRPAGRASSPPGPAGAGCGRPGPPCRTGPGAGRGPGTGCLGSDPSGTRASWGQRQRQRQGEQVRGYGGSGPWGILWDVFGFVVVGGLRLQSETH